MAENNSLEVQKLTTAVSQWTNSITNLVTKNFELCVCRMMIILKTVCRCQL